jgi:type II secretion system protein H
MSATGSKRGADTADAGFTLVEMLVTLAIVGLVAASLASFWPRGADRQALQAAAQTLTADLRLARGQAIARNQTVIVEFDANAGRYGNAAQQRVLPAGVVMAEGTSPQIFFRGDGTTPGGQIPLKAQDRQATVRVTRLSGQVEVVE